MTGRHASVSGGGTMKQGYFCDLQRPGWSEDWTVFYGEECIDPETLCGDGRTLRAHLNRRIDPRSVRIEYAASLLGPNLAGQASDLSCHVGPVRFCFGSRLNTFTGIEGPGRFTPAPAAPRMEPGRVHHVEIEIAGDRCRLRVDGEPAGELILDQPLDEGALMLYTWAGRARYDFLRVDTADGLPPPRVRSSSWITEKHRLRNLRQSIVWIEHKGKFLHECSLPGEGRDRGVYPAHPNGLQLSKDRFLILYSTRAYRGDDDEKSGVYQIRGGGYDGPVIKEGWICRTRDDWDPFGDGQKYVRQHGHPVAFGVPKGAQVGGRRAPHENVFGVLWRCEARWIDPKTGFMEYVQRRPDLVERTATTEWMQFRLNDAGDDIEIIQPPRRLRQAGYDDGPRFCSHPGAYRMTCNFALPTPYNADASEWVHADTFYMRDGGVETWHESLVGGGHNRGAVAVLRFRFNTAAGRYEWAQTGPLIGQGQGLFEGCVLPWRGSWILAARRAQADTVAWARTDDLFGAAPETFLPPDQPNAAPTVAYLCPDGIVRRTGGRADLSPYGLCRDPLYIMDIDPERNFAASNVRAVFDARAAGVPVPSSPIADFGKILPHAGGRTQLLLHRVRSPMLNDPARPDRRLTQEEVEASGIYWARIHYKDEWPGMWTF